MHRDEVTRDDLIRLFGGGILEGPKAPPGQFQDKTRSGYVWLVPLLILSAVSAWAMIGG